MTTNPVTVAMAIGFDHLGTLFIHWNPIMFPPKRSPLRREGGSESVFTY